MADIMQKVDLQTVGLCVASAIFGAALSYILTTRNTSLLLNTEYEKEKAKVCTSVDIEDLSSGTAAYCRCWKSAKFPYCDGSHNKHNVLTGDNLGPLLLNKE